jgi:RNA-binding protein
VIVGKSGVSEGLVRALDRALNDHEVIKVKLLDSAPFTREAFAAWTRETTGAAAVFWVGRTLIFYRRNAEDPQVDIGA